tara:strand:- start:24092 stop:24424 length:333 start_codon:yes stop_codon:yes gene_type:complete
MKNLPKKYIESMLDAQSQIIAQQKEIDQLKEESIKLEKDCEKLMTEMLIETHNTIHLNLELESENTKLKEANIILKERYESSCVSNVRRIGEIDKIESEYTKLKEALKLI